MRLAIIKEQTIINITNKTEFGGKKEKVIGTGWKDQPVPKSLPR